MLESNKLVSYLWYYFIILQVIDEAREIKNPELDLVEKGILAFEELPGLCKYFRRFYGNFIQIIVLSPQVSLVTTNIYLYVYNYILPIIVICGVKVSQIHKQCKDVFIKL